MNLSAKTIWKYMFFAILPATIITFFEMIDFFPPSSPSYILIDGVLRWSFVFVIPVISGIYLYNKQTRFIEKHPLIYTFVLTLIASIIYPALSFNWYNQQRGYSDYDVYIADVVIAFVAVAGNVIIMLIVTNLMRNKKEPHTN